MISVSILNIQPPRPLPSATARTTMASLTTPVRSWRRVARHVRHRETLLLSPLLESSMPFLAIAFAFLYRHLLHSPVMGLPFLLGHELTSHATAEPKCLLRLLIPGKLLALLPSFLLNLLLGLFLSLLPRRCLGTCQGRPQYQANQNDSKPNSIAGCLVKHLFSIS